MNKRSLLSHALQVHQRLGLQNLQAQRLSVVCNSRLLTLSQRHTPRC